MRCRLAGRNNHYGVGIGDRPQPVSTVTGMNRSDIPDSDIEINLKGTDAMDHVLTIMVVVLVRRHDSFTIDVSSR